MKKVYALKIATEDLQALITAIIGSGAELVQLTNLAEQFQTEVETKMATDRPRSSARRNVDQLTGQPAAVYQHLTSKSIKVAVLSKWFGEQYPHLSNPITSLSPIVASLYKRGFIGKDENGYFRLDLRTDPKL